MANATASQTLGPYWHLLEDPSWADLTRFGATGEKITLTGAILDGDGKPCPDACVEIWQSDPPASDSFPGFGRSNTDSKGMFRFITVKPGPVAWADQRFKLRRGRPLGWAQGFGIVFDDLVAALCTLVVIAIWRFA